MRIAVIGAGNMGGTLARRLAKLRHRVSIANSRGPESLTALAAEIGATPVSVVDAAHAGEIVCRDLGAAALRRALTEADRSRSAEYRAEEEAHIKRHIAAQTATGANHK
jgi:predicted dinucleotide-binding enzyme